MFPDSINVMSLGKNFLISYTYMEKKIPVKHVFGIVLIPSRYEKKY
jgi:hypothetical protein